MKSFLKAIMGIILIGGACIWLMGPEKAHKLSGTYKTDTIKGKEIMISVDNEENTFIQYIDQREVDKGVVVENGDKGYSLKSDKQDLKVKLSDNDSFDILVEGLNGKEPINIKKHTEVMQTFTTVFGDEEEYKELIVCKN